MGCDSLISRMYFDLILLRFDLRRLPKRNRTKVCAGEGGSESGTDASGGEMESVGYICLVKKSTTSCLVAVLLVLQMAKLRNQIERSPGIP